MPSVFLAIVIGLLMLLGSMLSYGIAVAFMAQLATRLMRRGYNGTSFWKNVGVMTATSVVTVGAHLVQIALWGVVFMLVGEISTLDAAFYLSAQNYTALGYGDIVLSAQWRLLGPLEAINGLLLFGLSTAVMFAVFSRMVTRRIRFKLQGVRDTSRTRVRGRRARTASRLMGIL